MSFFSRFFRPGAAWRALTPDGRNRVVLAITTGPVVWFNAGFSLHRNIDTILKERHDPPRETGPSVRPAEEKKEKK
ncbi:hypothetical protein ONS95_008089 [Cadophora gregata]|uniref:uncharacterized protein n=1 Tax=Cadophora gregata TaxID=51156 RepID=UPI0026DB44F9|nr:uncharacterized protein ONS95_008089 [Cadophora gregata]KAK0119234.1 hypothetical protein ONS96_012295 [Cadophora gregata f. sp. sojae]KAK0126492.1 hypothetical protein ONS95_008089 [Cadophora gregata]